MNRIRLGYMKTCKWPWKYFKRIRRSTEKTNPSQNNNNNKFNVEFIVYSYEAAHAMPRLRNFSKFSLKRLFSTENHKSHDFARNLFKARMQTYQTQPIIRIYWHFNCC